MRNPYRIEEPAAISFSGGRTSAYMLYKILEAHEGVLPDYVKVVFANTGKEMPQTLDFVRDCGEQWGVKIVWVECLARPGTQALGENMYVYSTRFVDYASASRHGEPFESLIKARAYLPNPVARFCTKELKVKRIKDAMGILGYDDFLNVIGIRYDERRRAVKLHGQMSEGNLCHLPLWEAQVTAHEVGEFWAKNNFDLALPGTRGVTDWGNCDLCFLKGTGKRLALIRERPELADWWIRMEQESPNRGTSQQDAGASFRKDAPTYHQMKIIATTQGQLFDFDDETIPCFCGD